MLVRHSCGLRFNFGVLTLVLRIRFQHLCMRVANACVAV